MLLPLGSSDRLGLSVTNRLNALEVFRQIALRRGYREITTPIVEYAATFTSPSVGMGLDDMMKWFNTQGEIEVLRPDWTIAIARALVKHPSSYKKWAYQGPIYDRKKTGLERRQAGIEIIDYPVLFGEAECLLMAETYLRCLDVGPVLIELGSTEIFDDFIRGLDFDGEKIKRLKKAMYDKKKDEVFSIVLEHSNQEIANEFASLVDAYGSEQLLEEYKDRWKKETRRVQVIEYLQKLSSILISCGVDDISFDLGQVNLLPYYSGTIFRGFIKEDGVTCFSGGRYDRLYDHFGKRKSAVGLAFDIDLLSEKTISKSAKETICVVATERTLAFAEQLRSHYQKSILDIQFEVDENLNYDRILYIVEDEGKIKVVEK